MNASRPAAGAAPSLARELWAAVRYYLGGRRGLLILGGFVVLGGAASSWGWLVAAGIAPLVLSVLPCVAMCALGLCMRNMAGGSAAKGVPDGHASAKPIIDPSQPALDPRVPNLHAPHPEPSLWDRLRRLFGA